jgi:hypothetical protein
MICKRLANHLALTTRRNGLATAVVYGLSLAVRFTSAAGEEVEIPPQSARAQPVFSFMNDNAQRPVGDWGKFTRPIVFRSGWPTAGSCRGACEAPRPAALLPTCPAP